MEGGAHGAGRGTRTQRKLNKLHPSGFFTGEKAQADLLETKHQAPVGSSGNRTVFSAKLLSLRLPSLSLLTMMALAHPHQQSSRRGVWLPGMEMLLAGPGLRATPRWPWRWAVLLLSVSLASCLPGPRPPRIRVMGWH